MLKPRLSQRTVGLTVVFGLVCFVFVGGTAWSQPVGPTPAEPAEPAAPEDQQYMGTKQCAACHFDQFMKWKSSKHATAFELLPAQYQTDQKCVACHTTGFGRETGFKTIADTPDLKGVSCEACHGPGSKHGEIAKQFANQKLTPEQAKAVNDSIWRMSPKNVCVSCHTVQGHHESETPPELRKK